MTNEADGSRSGRQSGGARTGRWMLVAAPLWGLLFGAAGVGAWIATGDRLGAATLPAGDLAIAGERERTTERFAALEDAAARLEASVTRVEALARTAVDRGASPHERFVLAMLHLQAAVASSRPWPREYQLAIGLAPPGAISSALAEVLASHAVRGLATEADLRERFAALAPAIVARAPSAAGTLDRAAAGLRSAFASIGVAAQPAPSDLDATLQRIQEHLRRGKLAAAVMDAETLDPAVMPLVAGWLSQARARLAVEQAIQETVLRAMSDRRDSPS